MLGALLLIAVHVFGRAGARVRVREGYADYVECAVLARRCDGRDVRIGLSRYWHGRAPSLRFAASHQHDVPRPRRGRTAPLVSRYGLEGAAWALVAGAIVEFTAYAALTFRDLKGAAAAVPGVVVDAFAGGIRP